MDKKQAMEEIVAGKHNRFGFKKAIFPDIQDSVPMEDGWFDLADGGYSAKVEENKLILELWFMSRVMYLGSLPNTAILDEKEVEMEYGKIPYVKVRVSVAEDDMDYVNQGGKRIYL